MVYNIQECVAPSLPFYPLRTNKVALDSLVFPATQHYNQKKGTLTGDEVVAVFRLCKWKRTSLSGVRAGTETTQHGDIVARAILMNARHVKLWNRISNSISFAFIGYAKKLHLNDLLHTGIVVVGLSLCVTDL
jgi:hypothetical protein